ncbi:MAG: hypothetical protein PSX81_11325 [bacterium]|nr:hypothetical protein [bacterium]
MGENYRPIATKCFENYLKSIGYNHKRTTGSHDQWTKAGKRTIPVWGDEKQLPAFHLKGNCKTLGITLSDLYAWAALNC